MHFLLIYDLAADYMQRRGEFRDAHLEKAWASHSNGELVLAGALTDPIDSAMLLFASDSPEIAEAFAKSDPYVTEGLVKSWRVREWRTVAGAQASQPVHPASGSAVSSGSHG